MASRPTNPQLQSRRTTKRGAFVDAIWQCDCNPRLPADKFQVKNGGKNHGRWCMCLYLPIDPLLILVLQVYTCQKPQHKRCGFFLWSDDAKVREEAAVLTNSRSEYPPFPQTPRKANTVTAAGPPTPETNKRPIDIHGRISGPEKELATANNDESFGWSSSDDEGLLRAEQELLLDQTLFETPHKVARTTALSSPGKRTYRDMDTKSGDREQWPLSDDVFATPTTSRLSSSIGLFSPSSTPARYISQPNARESAAEPSTLAVDALKILHGVSLSSKVEKNLIDLLDKHDLRTQGIVRGRDITRLAVQAKETKIAELQARITTLEEERETNRTVISLLKQDIAASPKKGGHRNPPPFRRSEV
ncbi:uncharacterized protein A1O9_01344 [Exophiala aquamarina CBS 119918]|uniref:Zinc finger GRF-type domain-containing protein n=1 Tax=Exophiala aquamarina CBS 119918 TaxID=1182545 RepID=A0A072PUG0_9EURO|nr:uncharacterized protein A1O9_01344 [Exophiala aquamarina CBS 119918]KEF63367.1 hypothetical protein A1O9_01344 [Exophiala aquamarina CBS 119918]